MKKNSKLYAVIETECRPGEEASTNLLSICDNRKEAIKDVITTKEKHFNKLGLSEVDYSKNVSMDIDTVFDYIDENGYEYHILACRPDYEF